MKIMKMAKCHRFFISNGILNELWNNQPNILIGVSVATLVLFDLYKITRYLSMKIEVELSS